MAVVSKQLLISKIFRDWGDSPQSEICISILEYLIKNRNNVLSHITFGSLKNIAKNDFCAAEILEATQYLCGERVKLLEQKFELIQDGENFDLSNDEVMTARKSGILIHPETGEEIHDFEDQVFIYFVPSFLSSRVTV
ncbi:hypothetical protein C1752_08258 [Acaryochloris thomasi RCC1774]|uniref:Uncharacterized protein n=1 Tax=Acaryochloris thomasi RCC1774 TaxID=1764569 RepID=A0A2W1JHK4_9CYAN|nr:hypothetical protein [Acaryochloris thomasi]PZD71055.1 hypothetical protein C1752_08258 [Acaryochloris thomasi RCC1774]